MLDLLFFVLFLVCSVLALVLLPVDQYLSTVFLLGSVAFLAIGYLVTAIRHAAGKYRL